MTNLLCEPETKTASELLQKAIEEALAFKPDEPTDEVEFYEDTKFGLFWANFSAVTLAYSNTKHLNYKGPRFTEMQRVHIEKEFEEIGLFLKALRKQGYSTEKRSHGNRKRMAKKEVPDRELQRLSTKLRSATNFPA